MIRQTALATLLTTIGATSAAHHSPANFDLDVTDFVITGTIDYVDFRNPHSVIELLVEDSTGATVQWYVEFSSVNLLLRRGWDIDKIEAGDKVTCVGNPSKNGAAEMYMWTIKLADGSAFSR